MYRLMYEYLERAARMRMKRGTIREYEVFLGTFFRFIERDYPDITDITDITREIVLSYEKYLVTKRDSRGKILSRHRRSRYLAGLRAFFDYLQKDEKIYRNPASNIAFPKLRKQIIRDVLTVEEIDALLKTCRGNSTKSLRDRAILELLYSSGIRADELCNIEVDDIDLDERVLFVRKGKLGNQRMIPFGDSARYWTLRYMESARPLIAGNSTLLFVTMKGSRFQPVTLCRIVKEYADKAGIEKNVTTHTMRHTCATHMLKGHADIRYVQKQLGHRSISTTEKYLKIEITDLKEVHERCHPREQEDW